MLAVTSCTSMRFEDFFSGYTKQLQQTRRAMLMADVPAALSYLPKQGKGHNAYSLSLLEQARLHFVMANWSESARLFDEVYQEIEHEAAKAKIQISSGFEQAGAVVSNDSAIQYQVPTYEQSMLHSYQALNYLFQDDFQAALVEVRRANLVQEQALKDNQKVIDQAVEKMRVQGIASSSLYQAYGVLHPELVELKNGFQNAYTFYLSGVLYEASGEINDAYIDYKKALEISPDNPFIQQDVLRLAAKLHMKDDLQALTERYGEIDNVKIKQDNGELVVFYEQGMIAAKREAKLSLPVSSRHGDMRFFSVSLPVYQRNADLSPPLALIFDQQSYQASDIVRLQLLAEKTLTEQLPAMASRQILRLLAKERLRRKMKQEGGDIGNILASLYSLASEHADTRSWQTLPQNIQVLRVSLPQGQHQLIFEHSNGRSEVEVKIESGRISLVNMTSFGDFTDVQTKNL